MSIHVPHDEVLVHTQWVRSFQQLWVRSFHRRSVRSIQFFFGDNCECSLSLLISRNAAGTVLLRAV